MNRPRIKRRVTTRRIAPRFTHEDDNSWLEVGDFELRLRGEGGLVWSRALPDAGLALGRFEFSSGELDTFDLTDSDEP